MELCFCSNHIWFGKNFIIICKRENNSPQELELNMFSLMEQLCAPRSTTRARYKGMVEGQKPKSCFC